MSSNDMVRAGFHYADDAYKTVVPIYAGSPDTRFTYTFENFFHPHVGKLVQQLNQTSVAGMLDPAFLQGLSEVFFGTTYAETPSELVGLETFPKQIDVRTGGPYANYNWELLFHLPLAVAVHLSKNQRFAEAQRWFHLIFDPTNTDTSVPAPQRFWKFLRFRYPEPSDIANISGLLALLSKPDGECTPDELALKTQVKKGYDAIVKNPFKPHAVARTRPVAYQYNVVMKYLDNLIAWGDSLFKQDTIESINDATLRYVLAANILGPRPVELPERNTARAKTFAQLAASLDATGNALVELEGQFPFNVGAPPARDDGGGQSGPLFGTARALYFCIPRNDKLLRYWDTVGDRLFKIRHCMNIEGVVRKLALFDPPIDPAMLVKAAAAGIDVGSIVGGLNQPASPVRSQLLIQKALETANELKALGAALLTALEKGDAEHLAQLRQTHEIALQQRLQETRFLQWKGAQEATKSLMRTRATTLERYKYYLRLLGRSADSNAAPDTLPASALDLTEATFDEAYATLVGQYDKTLAIQPLPPLNLAGGSAPTVQSGANGGGNLFLNSNEAAELNHHLPTARDLKLAANISNTLAAVLVFIPDFNMHLHFWGLGGSAKVFGGSTVSEAAKIAAQIMEMVAAWETDQAGMASRTASYQRRADEWVHQGNLAAHELMQIGRQVIGSLIAEQIAHREYLSAQRQVADSQDVQAFLQQKFTNEELYLWMQGELSRLYYEYYRFSFDVARKAERTMKTELMRPEVDAVDYVQFNYWDAGRQGLLSGETLYLDLRQMERAYIDNNKREFELTRHVSLRQLDPLALLKLRVTGSCEVAVPEWLYDMSSPGHYMRRIKNVALSLPSVVGPYTSVNCTLTLQRSTVRTVPLLSDGKYVRQPHDTRFADYAGSVTQVVTSTASNDSGLFETNLRDERYLPFEGAGAVGTWTLSLPTDFPAFDYSTIADVILHVRYTARQGGDLLGHQAIVELKTALTPAEKTLELPLLFMLRSDFSTEWSAFVNGTDDFKVRLRKDYFPYVVQNRTITVNEVELYGAPGGSLAKVSIAVPDLSGLNGPNHFADLSLSPDANVLKRDSAAQVFLVIQYSAA